MPEQWKEIAWYGMRFKIPADWQLSHIGVRYLVIEDEFGPVMEIKWAPIKGKFSQTAHLKRLAALQQYRLRRTIKPEPVSAEWASALTDFELSEFSWQSNTTRGRGVQVYCPICRHAAFVQFFQRESHGPDAVTGEILNSLRDHRSDGQVLWAAYDIRALMPETYQLKHYRFDAGQYELDFAEGRQRVILYRWALASVLLEKQDLLQFAETLVRFGNTEPVAGTIDGHDTVEWSATPATRGRRWLSRFQPGAAYCWLGLWHLKDQNRILGVRAEGKRPLDTEVLDHICAHYESI